MAKITGIVPGLMPRATAAHAKAEAERAKPKPKQIVPPDEIRCECCDGLIGYNNKRKVHTSPCKGCRNLFGTDWQRGSTNVTAPEALDKMAKLREAGWGMLLVANSFGAATGGSVSVDAGDVFPIKRAGAADRMEKREAASEERTRAIFTAQIDIGPHVLTLYPHEISPLSFVALMEMKKAGELVEQYVSADDKTGHFTPNEQLREQIYNCFGRMTGDPR